ncbi:MAG: diguanylate cyclase [Candidatus Thiodiazotropha sp.]
MPEEAIELLVLGNTTSEVETYLNALRNQGIAAHASMIAHDTDALSDELKKKRRLDLLIYTVESDALETNKLLALLGVIGSATPVIAVSEAPTGEQRVELMSQGITDLVDHDDLSHLVQVILREYKNVKNLCRLQHVERNLEEAEERCDTLTESSRDAIAYVHGGMHVTANRAYLELFGLATEDEIEGLPIMDMIAPSEHAEFKKLLRKLSADSEHTSEMKTTCVRSNGSKFGAELHFTPASIDGEPCTQVIIHDQSITREVEEKLRLLSTQDVQTGLYNRQYFLSHLDEEIRRITNQGQNPQTLYYVTLDNFTDIRSKTGIKSSDALLLEIAGMLRTIATHQDTLARFGDHTFTILSAEQDRSTIEKISQRICDGIEAKYLTESAVLVLPFHRRISQMATTLSPRPTMPANRPDPRVVTTISSPTARSFRVPTNLPERPTWIG